MALYYDLPVFKDVIIDASGGPFGGCQDSLFFTVDAPLAIESRC
jgi:hypothetical protein